MEVTERDWEISSPFFVTAQGHRIVSRSFYEADVAKIIAAAREEERERCARIVAQHPSESPDCEDSRGCCEVIEAKIRSGK
jgi:hypothetical protein